MNNLQLKLRTRRWDVELIEVDGSKKNYEVRELKSAERDRYLDSLSKRLRVDVKGNVVGINSYDGMQADLLTRCMHDSVGNKVEKKQLDEWPGYVVGELYRVAQELNGLRKPDDRAKRTAERLVAFLNGRTIAPDAGELEAFLNQTEKALAEGSDEPEKDDTTAGA